MPRRPPGVKGAEDAVPGVACAAAARAARAAFAARVGGEAGTAMAGGGRRLLGAPLASLGPPPPIASSSMAGVAKLGIATPPGRDRWRRSAS